MQQVRDTKGLRPTDEEILNLIAQLTQDVAVKYLIEKGVIEEPE